eukprot:CAMPEP_0170556378 /NCGR_PEP_ID=MMETSP0211-20121228/16495_1 /TAXON_ID=311385 /ORGANISM="Pseudokeronopsis sp., Strain OXSARD2" /LENGTH=50 /DNA_ID=CAMNT_0010866679 /DNA_START=594 /DNA_END=746 /DNA_ORIENTATION=-
MTFFFIDLVVLAYVYIYEDVKYTKVIRSMMALLSAWEKSDKAEFVNVKEI